MCYSANIFFVMPIKYKEIKGYRYMHKWLLYSVVTTEEDSNCWILVSFFFLEFVMFCHQDVWRVLAADG